MEEKKKDVKDTKQKNKSDSPKPYVCDVFQAFIKDKTREKKW